MWTFMRFRALRRALHEVNFTRRVIAPVRRTIKALNAAPIRSTATRRTSAPHAITYGASLRCSRVILLRPSSLKVVAVLTFFIGGDFPGIF
jgi:hypothetical protein